SINSGPSASTVSPISVQCGARLGITTSCGSLLPPNCKRNVDGRGERMIKRRTRTALISLHPPGGKFSFVPFGPNVHARRKVGIDSHHQIPPSACLGNNARHLALNLNVLARDLRDEARRIVGSCHAAASVLNLGCVEGSSNQVVQKSGSLIK